MTQQRHRAPGPMTQQCPDCKRIVLDRDAHDCDDAPTDTQHD
jgi:hypothetical protein